MHQPTIRSPFVHCCRGFQFVSRACSFSFQFASHNNDSNNDDRDDCDDDDDGDGDGDGDGDAQQWRTMKERSCLLACLLARARTANKWRGNTLVGRRR